MRDTTLPDGTTQTLYFADDHPHYPGFFKGMTQFLHERGSSNAEKKQGRVQRVQMRTKNYELLSATDVV